MERLSTRPEQRLAAGHWGAKQIAREVEARGAPPFLDEAQVDAGADFEEDLTPWALDRPYVWAEIGGSESRLWRCFSASRPLNYKRVPAYLCF